MNFKNQVALILCCSLLCMSYSPTAVETHVITLHVDTQTISNSNVNQVCNFGQTDGSTNEEFTLVVKSGDKIQWRGVSSSAPDTDEVLITSINHEGGARVFGRNVLRDSNANPGVVEGTVTDGKDGDEEKYKVSFKVLNNGEKRRGTFHIDPKIQIKN